MALTLRTDESDDLMIEKLKSITGCATSSKAILYAIHNYQLQVQRAERAERQLAKTESDLRSVRDAVSLFKRSFTALDSI